MAVPVKAKPITLAEYSAMGGDHPVEIVDGEVVILSPAKRIQSVIEHTLFRSLDAYVLSHDLGEAWIETTFVLDVEAGTNWVKGSRVPDVAFVSKQKLAEHQTQYGDSDDPFRLVPEIAVEVVSPNDFYSEINKKVSDYLYYGVQLVWVIDPQLKTVRVHTPADPDGHTLHAAETLTGAPILPDWSIPLADLFSR